jgi:hypothetical protein
MMHALKVAIERNPTLRSELRSPDRLGMLAHGAGNDAEHLRELGTVLDVTLPAAKSDVQHSIEAMDLTDARVDAHGIVWHVMGQPARWVGGPAPRFPTPVRIFARDDKGQRRVQACFNIPIPFQPLQPRCIPHETGAYESIEKVVDELAQLFLLVCPEE